MEQMEQMEWNGKILSYLEMRWTTALKGLLSLICAVAISIGAAAQLPENEDEEISVFLNIQGAGSLESPAFIRGKEVYLSIADIFSYLRIKATVSKNLDSISGIFIDEVPYLVDYEHQKIIFQQVHGLRPYDLVRTPTTLYLRSDVFGTVFGLNCEFSFRSLSVNITTKHELPVIREMRLDLMRQNLSKLNGKVVVDTTIRQSYPLFDLGMADWSVITTQQKTANQTMANLSLGGVVAGGETTISLNYNSNRDINPKDQNYLWRRTNNDNRIVKQVMVGKVQAMATASIFSPVVGVQLTNTPTVFRRSFGSYTLNNVTMADWMVELYVNNILVDYVKADASGAYSFQVPLVYGNSEVRTKFYGPWGEERSRVENIVIPYNFVPPGLLEYTVTGGIIEDRQSSRFGKGQVNYGVTSGLTVGGGVEYLSSVSTGNTMPFLTSSLRLKKGLILSADYTHGVRSRGALNYRHPSNLQFELNYTRFVPGQKAIFMNFSEEQKLTVSAPLRVRNFSVFSRFVLNRFLFPGNQYTTGEWSLSGSVLGLSTHLSSYGIFTSNAPYYYTNGAVSIRLPRNFVFTPGCQYDWSNGSVMAAKVKLDKMLGSKCYFTLFYEQNFRSGFNNMGFELKYDFAFAQFGFTARKINDEFSLLQMASGSLKYAPNIDYFEANNRKSVGRGHLLVVPFLDLNGNGKKDRDEPKAAGLKIKAPAGRVEFIEKDTVIRIFDLQPFSEYLLELDGSMLDNISWRLSKKAIKIVVDPNHFKQVNIPINVMGEVNGRVFRQTGNTVKEQGQIIVSIYKNDTVLVAKSLSEHDGYFSYLGLITGTYTVRIDPDQLARLNLKATPEAIPVVISRNPEGDVIEGKNFVLTEME